MGAPTGDKEGSGGAGMIEALNDMITKLRAEMNKKFEGVDDKIDEVNTNL